MASRIFFKLLVAFVAVIAAATLIIDSAVTRRWESSLREEIAASLTRSARQFALRVSNDRSKPIAQIVAEEARASEARATVIDAGGVVLADSEADPAKMENHAARPEFADALAGRIGSATRLSHTVGEEFLYVAAPVPNGAVRLAYPLSSVQQRITQVHRSILLATVVALLIALGIAAMAAYMIARRLRRIVVFAGRIAAGDLAARIEESSRDEVGQLAGALDKTAHQLEITFSQLEQSRSQLERLLESMQDAVIAVDVERRVQWLNSATRQLLPQARAEASVIEVVRDPDLLRGLDESFTENKNQMVRASSVAIGKVFSAIITPLPGGGAVLVLRDISDLESLEKTRRDFIANVSHELRTPLTSLQGYTEMLLDRATDPASRESLEIIRKNALRMSHLSEDLLTLARVESGEAKIQPRPTVAGELVHDVRGTFNEVVRSQGLDLKVREPLPSVCVFADPDAVHQVFANLIDNAIKYGSTGGKIEIGAQVMDEHVEFFVRDFGKGIASEHHGRLFERFYRVDSARSRDLGGTGLGLAIVKHIVRQHGGKVRVESELGHGATFFFSLPAVLVSEPAA